MVGWFPANRNKFGQYWPLPVHICPVKCGQDSSILSPKDLLFSFFNIVPAHCWSIWWRSRLQCCWFDDTDSLIFLPSTLFHSAFDNLLFLFLSIEITTLDLLQWEIFFSFSVFVQGYWSFHESFTQIRPKYLFSIQTSAHSLSVSHKHDKIYFAFSLLNAPFFVQEYCKINEVLNEDTPPKI